MRNQKKLQVYVYPDRSYRKSSQDNPYLDDLRQSLLSSGFEVIKSRTGWLGAIDLLFYLPRMDVVVANWLEETPNAKFGWLKSAALLIAAPVFKLTGKKLVWTIHNKISHASKRTGAIRFFQKFLFRFAHTCIAHAKNDLSFFGPNASRIIYFSHPFKPVPISYKPDETHDIDILLWGRIEPYKGIVEFLEYLKTNGILGKYRIHIEGKSGNQEYWDKLVTYARDNITIVNSFISDQGLSKLMERSRIVLFTHNNESLLSSGAMIESLNFNKTVIGPHNGNFVDLQREGLVYTFKHYDDLLRTIDGLTSGSKPLIDRETIFNFATQNSWNAYGNFLYAQVSP